MEKYIEEKEVFSEIKTTIYELCPIKKTKFDTEYTKKIELVINFYFYKDENNLPKLKFNIKRKNKLNDSPKEINYSVNKELSNETLGKLLTFILKEFSNIRSLDTYSKGFDIEFSSNIHSQEPKNIACNEITLKFIAPSDFQYDFVETFLGYLDYIITNFPENIDRTPQIRNEYKKYCLKIRTAMINFYNVEELRHLIEKLSNGELINLLFGIDNETFFTLFGENIHSKIKAKKLELKRIDIDSDSTKY